MYSFYNFFAVVLLWISLLGQAGGLYLILAVTLSACLRANLLVLCVSVSKEKKQSVVLLQILFALYKEAHEVEEVL